MQRKVTNLCASLKADYIGNKINDNNGNQKVLVNITNSLLHRNMTKQLPTQLDPQVFGDMCENDMTKCRY